MAVKIKLSKCDFFKMKTTFVGHDISTNGIELNKKYIEKVLKFKRPKSKNQIKRLIGLLNWLIKFIPGLMINLAPIIKRLSKNIEFGWTELMEKRFNKIKQMVLNALKLHHPDYNKPFEIVVDSSIEGYGGAILQKDKMVNIMLLK